jgi:signal transduction histidine kinase
LVVKKLQDQTLYCVEPHANERKTSACKGTRQMSLTLFRERDCSKLILPSLLAIILFVISVFGILLPGFKESLLESKKETIQELTATTWDILSYYNQKETTGELSRETSQALAINEIKSLRYGPEEKDYFWINDMQPKMVMHPYLPELDGQTLTDYADPEGKHLFVAFVDTVRKYGEGFVPYMWQWKDDPTRVVKKLSFVKGFEPWGWVIGTGMYLDDVDREISNHTRNFSYISTIILILVILLSGYIVRQGIQTTLKRKQAEEELKKYHSRLEIMVAERTKELGKALSDVKKLSGLLPICASCKKIRDDKGYWNQIEEYIRDRSEAEFTHSICEECAGKLYPGFTFNNNNNNNNTDQK